MKAKTIYKILPCPYKLDYTKLNLATIEVWLNKIAEDGWKLQTIRRAGYEDRFTSLAGDLFIFEKQIIECTPEEAEQNTKGI